jgi:predicted PilT family ATPase
MTPSQSLAAKKIEQELNKYTDSVKVEMTSDHKCVIYVPESDVSAIIGRQGKNIEKIEDRLGIGIDVRKLEKTSDGKELSFDTRISKKAVQFVLGSKYKNRDVNVHLDGDLLLNAKVGKTGILNVHRKNRIGAVLAKAVNMGEKIKISLG